MQYALQCREWWWVSLHCTSNERGGLGAQAFNPSFRLKPQTRKTPSTHQHARGYVYLASGAAYWPLLTVTTPSGVTEALPFVCGPTRVTEIVP